MVGADGDERSMNSDNDCKADRRRGARWIEIRNGDILVTKGGSSASYAMQAAA
jgi:hypothetical protein